MEGQSEESETKRVLTRSKVQGVFLQVKSKEPRRLPQSERLDEQPFGGKCECISSRETR